MSYFDRNGQPIDRATFGKLFDDNTYKRIDWTDLGPVRVSTVWLGSDHRFLDDGPPLIFETMVFPNEGSGWDRFDDLDCERYSTLEEATAGHAAMVERWRGRTRANPPDGGRS